MCARTVVFDLPYFDISKAPNVRGVVAWGAHDAGTDFSANPPELLDELVERHGLYPASPWIYGFAWPSSERCQVMGTSLAKAVALRSNIALWLLTERFPDWDLALIGVSESHSVLEALWHGIDEQHLLYRHASAPAAARGVQAVYRAIDQLVDTLTKAFPESTILIFSMHGMGPNRSDVPSMVLLPELLHRFAFDRPLLEQPESWSRATSGVPILGERDEWDVVLPDVSSAGRRIGSKTSKLLFKLWRRTRDEVVRWIPSKLRNLLRRKLIYQNRKAMSQPRRESLEWMPAARYQPLWHKMPAFALPSYYDGKIRLNLQGRESTGIVPLEKYELHCEEIRRILNDCRDPYTGDHVIDHIGWPGRHNPLELAPSRADLDIKWKGSPLCLEHPDLGRVGPIPFRRTGGHTGPHGMAYLISDVATPGEYGVRSSFDVVPTLFDLLNERPTDRISGHSLLKSVVHPSLG
jgi:hypothetical protein